MIENDEANREKSYERLDTVIGMVKKRKKKSNLAIRKKFGGLSMKNVVKTKRAEKSCSLASYG